MKIARPRLIDVFGVDFHQDEVDFAIPKLHEDIPLWVDPFLLWSSEKPEYRALHERLLSFFRLVAELVRDGEIDDAAMLLAGCKEPVEMGLGYTSGSRRGSNLGAGLIADILSAHRITPQLLGGRIRHLEELQLVVPKIAEDRVSDTASSIIKDFFLSYTASRAEELGVPTRPARPGNIFDPSRKLWVPAPEVQLPYNPVDDSAILFSPLDLLRRLPWINYEDYYRHGYVPRVLEPDQRRRRVAKDAVLAFNARHYKEVERYVDDRERAGDRCSPDPLFKPLALSTIKTKLRDLKSLPTGRENGADQDFEKLVHDIASSLFYPTLEFAESRVRTASGSHIRDLIFYNDGKNEFWQDLKDRYEARQPVFELKNVQALETEHVNQLYRYLDEEFGRFGVLVTRRPAPDKIVRNTVDLHSSKRAVILCVDDRDLELMVAMAESGRDPTDVLKKKFIDFSRQLPK